MLFPAQTNVTVAM